MGSRCYTTGAYIEPVKDANGKWHWEVTEFNEDTFDNKGNILDPDIIANTEKKLINKELE